MEEKTCRKCLQTKPVAEFSRRQRGDGYQSWCKQCRRGRYREHCSEEKQSTRRYQARHRVDHRFANHRWRKRRRELVSTYSRRYRAEHPEAMRAHLAIFRAVHSGRLRRKPCEQCGATENVRGHHDDYSKPLEVRWLCESCHQTLHAQRRAE